MDLQHLDYRVTQLENESLPRRMQAAELVIGQLQGEVTAIKEIARGIGVKLDSGVEKLTTDSTMKMNELKMEQARNQSFVKGVLWVGGVVGTLFALGPAIGDIAKRLLGV